MSKYQDFLTEALAARADLDRAIDVINELPGANGNSWGKLTVAASILADAKRVIKALLADINAEAKALRNGGAK